MINKNGELSPPTKNNQIWAENCVDRDPEFFSRLSKLQEPEFLWIGCSDSRVPSNSDHGDSPR